METKTISCEEFPRVVPVISLKDRPIFPKMMLPLVISGERIIKFIREIWREGQGQYIGLIFERREDCQHLRKGRMPDDTYHRVGVIAKITQVNQPPNQEVIHVVLRTLERFEVLSFNEEVDPHYARIECYLEEALSPAVEEEAKSYSVAIINAVKDLIRQNPLFREELSALIGTKNIEHPGMLADLVASMTTASGEELQDILEIRSIRERLERTLVLVKKEVEITQTQTQINKRIEDQLSKQQRESFLRQQLKEIKKELGISKDDKESVVDHFVERVEKLLLSDEAKIKIQDELEKLKFLENASPEYYVTRNYLDWITSLPWGKTTEDCYELDKAIEVLDGDHFGLADVKERILEFMAIGKIKGQLKSNIILLVGPPGVGKTSIGQSIARCLGRSFYRFSLGGMRDEAEIKGHRRTYIGAMPGKFIQAIKASQSQNPIIMLDEIDKVGHSYHGDPASALLEVLDPEQNKDFLDHYLDLRFDLSQVLFICTANTTETIPAPLLDRMETIRLSGYILEEKIEIAKRHLMRKLLSEHGVSEEQIKIPIEILGKIIDGYAREAGVRGLEKCLKKIYRRGALKLLREHLSSIELTAQDLSTYLGPKSFRESEMYRDLVPGVAMGLAYTIYGGETLYVEATKAPTKSAGFKQTGQLGSVMIESAELAYSFIRSLLSGNQGDQELFDRHCIHLHVPAGATPKDGPSAGITMAMAIYSLVMNQRMRPKMAMTGELTLTGRVMPVGGIKEKLIAAKRGGILQVLLPQGNREEFLRLDSYLTEGMEVLFVENFEQVVKHSMEKR